MLYIIIVIKEKKHIILLFCIFLFSNSLLKLMDNTPLEGT